MTTAERQPISQNSGRLNKEQFGRRLISYVQYAILVARLYGPVDGIGVQEDRIPGGVTCKSVFKARERRKGLAGYEPKKARVHREERIALCARGLRERGECVAGQGHSCLN